MYEKFEAAIRKMRSETESLENSLKILSTK